MGREGAAGVGGYAKEDGLPEVGDLGHVRLEIELSDGGEEVADHRVVEGLAVEGAHQPLDIRAPGEIVQLRSGRHPTSVTHPRAPGPIAPEYDGLVATLVDQHGLPKPTWRGLLHQWGFFAALAATGVLLLLSNGLSAHVASAIYGASLCAMLGASALYHRGRWSPAAAARARRLDHSMIFVFVAGSYTPFALLLLEGTMRVVVLAAVWLLAATGAAITNLWPEAPRWMRSALYLGMGWGSLALVPGVLSSAGAVPLLLLAAGGVLYSVGALIYVRQRPNPAPLTFGHHEIFHAFVLAAACVHWAAVAGYALPAAG